MLLDLYVRLPVNSKRLKFWVVKSYMWIFDGTGVSTPTPAPEFVTYHKAIETSTMVMV